MFTFSASSIFMAILAAIGAVELTTGYGITYNRKANRISAGFMLIGAICGFVATGITALPATATFIVCAAAFVSLGASFVADVVTGFKYGVRA